MSFKTILTLIFITTMIIQSHAQSFLQGPGWTARKVSNTYIVSINDKSSILEALTDFVKAQKIKAGEITGVGAVNQATLRFFNPETKKYVDKTFNEQLEITNMSGNLSEALGQPLLHLHITLGKSDYTALAGHLLDAKVRGACEIFINAIDSKIIKEKNEEIGLNFYNFSK